MKKNKENSNMGQVLAEMARSMDAHALEVELDKVRRRQIGDWRKSEPIRVVNGVKCSTTKEEVKKEVKVQLINEMKYLAKITRGLYSGDLKGDMEYESFCEKVLDQFITEKSEANTLKIVEIYDKSPRTQAVPDTNPIRLGGSKWDSIADHISTDHIRLNTIANGKQEEKVEEQPEGHIVIDITDEVKKADRPCPNLLGEEKDLAERVQELFDIKENIKKANKKKAKKKNTKK